uniref:ABC transporter ATP-binding protein n=1 Tax=candidate division WOR-3 bacterium TaxID=2052148 RepID=A0A7C2K666_UNCW3
MANVILKVANLCKYFGGVVGIEEVSFELKEGELLGIIGPNGAGKTTLINLITGFVKADKGKVIFKGRDITNLPPWKIAQLGIVRTFQLVKPFYRLPAYKNLVVALCSPRVKTFRGGKYGKRDETALNLLEDVGFERDSAVPYKQASDLPHGYLKRLELARCLALRPEVLILDELFSGMSIAELGSTLPIIKRFKEEGKGVIMVEHRLKELFEVADRVIVLNFGKIIAEGTTYEILENEDVRSAYLGAEEEEAINA